MHCGCLCWCWTAAGQRQYGTRWLACTCMHKPNPPTHASLHRLQIFEQTDAFRDNISKLELIASMHNSIQASILPVERPLVAQLLAAVEAALKKGSEVGRAGGLVGWWRAVRRTAAHLSILLEVGAVFEIHAAGSGWLLGQGVGREGVGALRTLHTSGSPRFCGCCTCSKLPNCRCARAPLQSTPTLVVLRLYQLRPRPRRCSTGTATT